MACERQILPTTEEAEYLPAEVIEEHRLTGRAPVWIEYSSSRAGEGLPEWWSAVLFAHHVPEDVLAPRGVWCRRIGRAERKPLDRQTVEALVGGRSERWAV